MDARTEANGQPSPALSAAAGVAAWNTLLEAGPGALDHDAQVSKAECAPPSGSSWQHLSNLMMRIYRGCSSRY